MTLPDLTVCICTYKRPYYAINTIQACVHKLLYAGKKKFLISDGGSPDEHLNIYNQILQGHDYQIVGTNNLSDMMNACAANSGDLWWVTLDDFIPNRRIDLSPDARFLLANEDVGAVRMGRLAFWEHGEGEQIHAQLRMSGGLHWWVIDKARSNHPYTCSINTTLYHRRFWNAYGDIPPAPPDVPGEAEVMGAQRYNEKDGPTIAVPVRFGEDCAEWLEPITHYGCWRTDEYTASGGRRL